MRPNPLTPTRMVMLQLPPGVANAMPIRLHGTGRHPTSPTGGCQSGPTQRSMSRCVTLGSKPRSRSRAAISSAMTTDRWWPPVQPSARVR